MTEEKTRTLVTVEVGLLLLKKAQAQGLITMAQYQKAAKIYQEISA